MNTIKLYQKAVAEILQSPKDTVLYFVVFMTIASILQWLFQINILYEIVTNTALSAIDKTDVFIQAFLDLFRLINDFTPILILSVAFFQSLTYIFLLKMKQSLKISQIALPAVSAGCVACGGSVLSSVANTLFSGAAISSVVFIGELLFVIALIMSIVVCTRALRRYFNG